MRKVKILFIVFLTVGILFFAAAASIGIAGAAGLFSSSRRYPLPPPLPHPLPAGFSVEADGDAIVVFDGKTRQILIGLPEGQTEFDPARLRFPERYSLFRVRSAGGATGQPIPVIENAGFEIDLKYEPGDGAPYTIYRLEVLFCPLPNLDTTGTGLNRTETAGRETRFRSGSGASRRFRNRIREDAP